MFDIPVCEVARMSKATSNTPASRRSFGRRSFPSPSPTPVRPRHRCAFRTGATTASRPFRRRPDALQAVFQESARLGVTVHRVTQGSGVMMLTDAEISDMLAQCAAVGVELCLFLGPRASWDIGAGRFTAAGNLSVRARGRDALRASASTKPPARQSSGCAACWSAMKACCGRCTDCEARASSPATPC